MTERDTGSTAYESGIEYYTKEAEDTRNNLLELGKPDLENWNGEEKLNYVKLLERHDKLNLNLKHLKRRNVFGLLK